MQERRRTLQARGHWFELSCAHQAGPRGLPEPLVVTRRVSIRGAIMVGGQKIQVGLVHARKTAQITVESDTYQITVAEPICRTSSEAGQHPLVGRQGLEP